MLITLNKKLSCDFRHKTKNCTKLWLIWRPAPCWLVGWLVGYSYKINISIPRNFCQCLHHPSVKKTRDIKVEPLDVDDVTTWYRASVLKSREHDPKISRRSLIFYPIAERLVWENPLGIKVFLWIDASKGSFEDVCVDSECLQSNTWCTEMRWLLCNHEEVICSKTFSLLKAEPYLSV